MTYAQLLDLTDGEILGVNVLMVDRKLQHFDRLILEMLGAHYTVPSNELQIV